MSTPKEMFGGQVLAVANDLIDINTKCAGLAKVFTSRGYNSGGGDEITDSDLATLGGVTAADLFTIIAAIQQFTRLLGNLTVTQGDYLSDLYLAETAESILRKYK